MQTFIKDISKQKDTNNKITIKGWVFNKRSSGKIHFLQIRDGSGFIQAVLEESKVSQETIQLSNSLTIESSVIITGTPRKDDRAPSGFEMDLISIQIIQLADEYPIQKKEHGTEFLLDNRHLWLRSQKQWAIQQIRNTVINAIYEHLNSQGFIKIDSPILTPTACEGTTTLFKVPYTPAWKEGESNGPKAYLSQSGQLYIEAAIFAHGRVFDFGPTFRAEKSKTRRHLTEFWMMDAEAAFVEHAENMKIQEGLTVAIVKKALENNKYELEVLERDISLLEPILEGNFPIIPHSEAVKRVKEMGAELGDRDDLGAEEDTLLSKSFKKPFFVEKYPKEIKPFYMKDDPDDPTRYLNNDMYAPEGYGELIGGSQREDDHNALLAKMKEHKIPLKDYQWYLDLRK
ncbi:asparagine--tRNA ligase, partial [Patescibacteria group bacterium]|nr:asparagine--tRNA ligase [Patescibacteria group bacterium]